MRMKLETLRCNHCGGPLTVPESANFVTCNHCHSQLAIRRTDSTTFTEELGEIKSNQKQMMDQLAQLERQNRIEQVDREWERERENYLTTDKNGRRSAPSEAGAILGGVIAVGFGIFWTMMASSMNAGPMPIFGLLFICFGIGVAIYGYNKAKDYRAAQRRYQRRRSEVFNQPRSNAESYGEASPISTPMDYLENRKPEEHRG
jgi:hypothetical protein